MTPYLRFSSDTEFGLSLNGSKLLTDTAQTLASCGIVSGDLICVHLPQSEATAAAGSTSSASSTSSTYTAAKSSANQRQSQQTPIMASTQVWCSPPAGCSGGLDRCVRHIEPVSSPCVGGQSTQTVDCLGQRSETGPESIHILLASVHSFCFTFSCFYELNYNIK